MSNELEIARWAHIIVVIIVYCCNCHTFATTISLYSDVVSIVRKGSKENTFLRYFPETHGSRQPSHALSAAKLHGKHGIARLHTIVDASSNDDTTPVILSMTARVVSGLDGHRLQSLEKKVVVNVYVFVNSIEEPNKFVDATLSRHEGVVLSFWTRTMLLLYFDVLNTPW